MALSSSSSSWRECSPYKSVFDSDKVDDSNDESGSKSKTIIYSASCYCGRVQYDVLGDPLDTKLCHCHGCQKLHGAPFEWVSIFNKGNVRFKQSSLQYLFFYNSEIDYGWTSQDRSIDDQQHFALPVKVSCNHCRTPIADEGRNMWLAFNTLFDNLRSNNDNNNNNNQIPDAFQHNCHLFYSQRCIDIPDDKTKWIGHKGKSSIWKEEKEK